MRGASLRTRGSPDPRSCCPVRYFRSNRHGWQRPVGFTGEQRWHCNREAVWRNHAYRMGANTGRECHRAITLTQHFAPNMPPGSSIVNILSIAAKTGFANWSAYCMSKFALEGFSQSVREELRERKIRVINIYPAATSTDIWNKVEGDWPRNKMISAEQVASAVVYALSRPADVAVENITLSSATGNL